MRNQPGATVARQMRDRQKERQMQLRRDVLRTSDRVIENHLDQERQPDAAKHPEYESDSHALERLLEVFTRRRRLLYDADVGEFSGAQGLLGFRLFQAGLAVLIACVEQDFLSLQPGYFGLGRVHFGGFVTNLLQFLIQHLDLGLQLRHFQRRVDRRTNIRHALSYLARDPGIQQIKLRQLRVLLFQFPFLLFEVRDAVVDAGYEIARVAVLQSIFNFPLMKRFQQRGEILMFLNLFQWNSHIRRDQI